MVKETGYCDYNNQEWIKKYDGLTYCNDRYYTRIVGNTFYISINILKDNSYKWNWFEKLIIKKLHINNWDITNICIIPMIKTQEETIRDVLRSWNFNVKYKWLDEDLK